MEMVERCLNCGVPHLGRCTRIAAVEYYPDGTVKRIEYRDDFIDRLTVVPQMANPASPAGTVLPPRGRSVLADQPPGGKP